MLGSIKEKCKVKLRHPFPNLCHLLSWIRQFPVRAWRRAAWPFIYSLWCEDNLITSKACSHGTPVSMGTTNVERQQLLIVNQMPIRLNMEVILVEGLCWTWLEYLWPKKYKIMSKSEITQSLRSLVQIHLFCIVIEYFLLTKNEQV